MLELATKFKEWVMITGAIFFIIVGIGLLIDYVHTKWGDKWNA